MLDINNHKIYELREECPRIWNTWRSIIQYGKKHQLPICERWTDFKKFYQDVRPTYERGLVFRRIDNNRSFEESNYIWIKSEDAYLLSKTTIFLEYDGKRLSFKEWARELNTTSSAISIRYHRHKNDWTIEEILFGKAKKRNDKRPTDWRVSQNKPRIKASKMIRSYKCSDRKKGLNECDMTIDWFIENIMTKPCVYCGDTKRIGADRIDNEQGHIIGNVVPCCYECNCARNVNFTHEEMLILGETIKKIKSNRPQNVMKEKHNEEEFIPSQVRHYNVPIICCNLKGDVIKTYKNVDDVVNNTTFKRKNILMACKGRRHNSHKYQNYLWFYKNEKL